MPEITVDAKVTPKAKERGLKVDAQGLLRVRTPKPPEDGKANEDVIELVAEHFGVAKSCVRIVAGHTASRKKLAVLK